MQRQRKSWWTSHAKKKKNLDTDFTTFTRINFKWITDLNVKCKSIKLLEDNVGENVGDFVFAMNDLLKTPPRGLPWWRSGWESAC